MNKTGKFTVGLTFLVCTLLALVLLPGCGNNPVAPDIDAPYSYDNGLRGLKYADSLLNADGGTTLAKRGHSLETADDEAEIGPEGGLVRFTFENGEGWLEVPGGALSENTTIYAEAVRLVARRGHVTLFDFHPDGLVFEVPAVLTLEVPDLHNGAWLHLSWYNTDTGKWEFQERARIQNGKVSFEVSHFSKYGIS